MNSQLLSDSAQSIRMTIALARDYAAYLAWIRRRRPVHHKGWLEILDIHTFYRAYGKGEPVLLLHGGFMFAETWAGQIPALVEGYHVITPDSRGQGRTTLGERPLTYRQMAEDTAALIERLDLGRVNLIGWSDGGCTSLALAIERPELVRSLVLLGTSYHTDNYAPAAKRKVEGILRPTSISMLGLRAIRRLLTPEPEKEGAFLEKMRRLWTELPDFSREELGRIKAPTLVIACDRDEFLSLNPDPLQVFREIADAIPDSRLEVVTGGTHSVHMERPREVNRLILDFLRKPD